MTIDPKTLSPRDAYNILVGAVVPRPIAFVTSMNDRNIVNAAPYSFFNALTGSPPLIMISVGRKNGQMKHTAENILRQKEFVVNLVTDELVHSMNISSADFPEGTSEIDQAKLTLVASTVIRTPRIATSKVNCECVLHKHLEIGTDPTDLIIGEIVQFHVKDEFYSKGAIDQGKLRPIARMGGNFYSRTNDLFELDRPTFEQKK
jgi:flavin reductase (DIM6/NTAB) family NADH-FMN oxidoreductase RutF